MISIERKYVECNTQTEQRKIEREYDTVLLELDASRMCTSDPMHNLLLGTAKHVIDVWKRLEVINTKDFDRKKVIALFALLIGIFLLRPVSTFAVYHFPFISFKREISVQHLHSCMVPNTVQ